MLTYIVNLCTQTGLHQSNGVTIYLLVGSLLILRLRPKTCLDSSVFSPVFPSVFPLSHSNTLTPPDFFQPPFLCHVLLLIVSSYWGCHHYPHTYTHIPTFIKIPRDPHEFRGVPWNLFRHWIVFKSGSPLELLVLGYQSCWGLCLTLTNFVIGQRLTDPLGTSRMPSLKPWSLYRGWAHCDKAQG